MKPLANVIFICCIILLCTVPGISQESQERAKEVPSETNITDPKAKGLRKIATGTGQQELNIYIDKTVEATIETAMKAVEIALDGLEIDLSPINIDLGNMDFRLSPIDINVPEIDIEPIEVVIPQVDIDIDVKKNSN
jgi:hypothetical protein